MSAADTNRPDTDQPSGHRPGSGRGSGPPRRPPCPGPQLPGHRPRCPAAAGRRRTHCRRSGSTAAPPTLRLLVGAGHWARSTQPWKPAVRTRGHRRWPAGAREPARPLTLRTPATGQGLRTLGSGQAGQPPAGVSTTAAVSGRTGPPCVAPPASPPDRQLRSLVRCLDLVGSRPIWPAQVGGFIGRVGSRRVQSDRLDDHRDDQAARRQSTTAGWAGVHGCRVAPSLPWVGGQAPCYPAFEQFASHRRSRSYVLSVRAAW